MLTGLSQRTSCDTFMECSSQQHVQKGQILKMAFLPLPALKSLQTAHNTDVGFVPALPIRLRQNCQHPLVRKELLLSEWQPDDNTEYQGKQQAMLYHSAAEAISS